MAVGKRAISSEGMPKLFTGGFGGDVRIEGGLRAGRWLAAEESKDSALARRLVSSYNLLLSVGLLVNVLGTNHSDIPSTSIFTLHLGFRRSNDSSRFIRSYPCLMNRYLSTFTSPSSRPTTLIPKSPCSNRQQGSCQLPTHSSQVQVKVCPPTTTGYHHPSAHRRASASACCM